MASVQPLPWPRAEVRKAAVSVGSDMREPSFSKGNLLGVPRWLFHLAPSTCVMVSCPPICLSGHQISSLQPPFRAGAVAGAQGDVQPG